MKKPAKIDYDKRLSEDELETAVRVLRTIETLVATPKAIKSVDTPPEVLARQARRIMVTRQARARFFPPSMFGEAAWDTLLALFVADQESGRTTVTSACHASGLAPSTAMRWIDFLDREGLLTRRQHPFDGRSVLLEITDDGRERVAQYLTWVRDRLPLD